MRAAHPALLALALVACDGADPQDPNPYADCMEDADAECCANADCDDGDICWFSYICSPTPEGDVECSQWSGDRACHAQCPGGTCADTELECTETTIFPGSDAGVVYFLCL